MVPPPRAKGAAPKLPAKKRNTINIFMLTLTAQMIVHIKNRREQAW